MKIEKLDENKIRITLNTDDLAEKNIDFHTLLSNPLESQKIFLGLLDEAEKSVGFLAEDCNLLIEALAVNGKNFIFTVTKVLPSKDTDKTKFKKIRVHRKIADSNVNPIIYSFSTFENFCEFSNVISKLNIKDYISENNLYKYNDVYYLVLKKWDDIESIESNFYLYASEFGEFVKDSELFERKLIEHGEIIMSSNAIRTCNKHFA